MGSYKKIGLSHEMGLIDTPPLFRLFSFQDLISGLIFTIAIFLFCLY